jgi:hypothetical protein
VVKCETGAFDDEVRADDLLQEYEAKIAVLARRVNGKRFTLVRVLSVQPPAEKREYISHHRRCGFSAAKESRLMGRSS